MKFEILLSCMNQPDMELVRRSNIRSSVLVINQCGEDREYYADEKCRVINTTERGLSRSRNMAIRNSDADICLLADDDEVFYDNVESIITRTYKKIDADIIIFDLENYHKRLPCRITKLGYTQLLRVSSVQITFNRRRILEKKMWFDINLGSGTKNGGGEENKFLWDAKKSGLKIVYVPQDIGILQENGSQWFSGFNRNYFVQRGAATRYYMGSFFSLLYGIYFLISKSKLYRKDCSFLAALRYFMYGHRKGINKVDEGKK